MKIENIKIKGDAYIKCKSCFYSALVPIDEIYPYEFSVGVNKLVGEIDSRNWGISYLISMYPYLSRLERKTSRAYPLINNKEVSIQELSKYACYMDEIYPLFSTKRTIRKLVSQGIKKSGMKEKPENIRDVFYIDPERFERPICGVGNERFKAMAAIAYCNQKEVFCFPWLSKKRFDYYHYNMLGLLEVLKSLKKVVILPVGE